MSHTLAVITVVYENYTVLEDFLNSLSNQTNKNFQLFISDLSKLPQKIDAGTIPATITSGKNKGYAYGINLSLKKAMEQNIDSFCVVNDDTYFKNDFIAKVENSLTEHTGSIIGGKIYYAPGFEYHKNRYEKNNLGKVFWYAGGRIEWKHATAVHRGVDEVDQGQFDNPGKTDFVTGCFLAYDKQVVEKVGDWDESFFMYYEDADFCERAKKRGVSIYFDPSIVLWHKNAASTGGSGSRLHQQYQTKNQLRFGLRYAPFRTKLHLLKNYFLS